MIIERPWGRTKPPLGVRHNPSHSLSQGLIGHWIMNEGGGQTLYDCSGNNWRGTFGASTAAPTWSSGVYSRAALTFDGSNDQVNIGRIDTPTTAISISAWVKVRGPVSSHNAELIVGKKNATSSPWFSYRLTLGNNSSTINPYFQIRITASGSEQSTTPQSVTISADEWHFLVGTWMSGTPLSIYIDGRLAETSSGNVTGTMGYNAFDTYIGWNEVDNVFLDAQVDDVRMYNRAISHSEIRLLYLSPFVDMIGPELVLVKAPSAAVSKGAYAKATHVVGGAF